MLRDHRHQLSGLALRLDDLISLRHRGFSRFLDDHVLAGLERLDRHLAMPTSRCAHHNNVDGDCGESFGERSEDLATVLDGQPLGAVGVQIDHRCQLDLVGQLADHLTVYGTDHTCAYQGNLGSIVRIGRGGAHAYAIPSLVKMSVKARQDWVKSSGPECTRLELTSPRCGSREKKPSKPSARSARIVSTTSPSPAPATTTVPSASSASLIWM